MKITQFEDIEAWKSARQLNTLIFTTTPAKKFASDFDLQRQIRKAATSVMANIAEGFDAGSDPEFARFLRIAQRSTTEVKSHLYVALDRKYIDQALFDSAYSKCDEVRRLIGGFIKYLKQDSAMRKGSTSR